MLPVAARWRSRAPSCLYCGAPLSAQQLAAAAAAEARSVAEGARPAAARPAVTSSRVLLVVDPAGASVEALARATGLSAYDARLLARRGGLHLLRALEAGAAGVPRRGIAGEGVRVVEVPEAEARERPLRVAAGERRGGSLLLRGEEGVVEVSGQDLLLIVSGEIAREHRRDSTRRRRRHGAARRGLAAVHLHRAADLRPIEIDVTNFETGFALTGSSRLEVDAWLDGRRPAVPRDDGFRSAAAGARARGARAARPARRRLVAAPRERRRPRARRRGRGGGPGAARQRRAVPLLLGWRAAVERRRRGSRPAPAAC